MTEGKKKGNRAERAISRRFSEWLTGETDPPVLWPSVVSGGWAQKQKYNVGDLKPNGPNPKGREFRDHFGIEVKHRDGDLENIFHKTFSQSQPSILSWWDKISQECYEHDLCSLLVFRKNYYPWLIGYPPGLLPMGSAETAIRFPLHGLHIIELDEFLEHDPDDVMECARKWRGDD